VLDRPRTLQQFTWSERCVERDATVQKVGLVRQAEGHCFVDRRRREDLASRRQCPDRTADRRHPIADIAADANLDDHHAVEYPRHNVVDVDR